MNSTTGLNIRLPNLTLPGNCIIVAVQNAPAPGVTVSVSDDRNNTYLSGPAVTDASGNVVLSLFYAVSATAGVQHITASFTGSVTYVAAVASEWYDVATASAFDGGTHSSNTNPTSTWSAGTFTPGTNGDLVYQVAVDHGSFLPYSSSVAGTGFTLASADLLEGMVAQYEVQRRAGAVTPTITVNGSGGYASAAMALKAAPAGTRPGPGIRIVHAYAGNTHLVGTATVRTQFPSSGNLVVFTMSQGDQPLNSVADGNGNTYIQVPGSPVGNGFAGFVEMYYAANTATRPSLTFTMTFAAGTALGSSFLLYDITNARASPFDVSNTAIGNQTTTANLFTVSLTPAGAGELVIAHGDQDSGTITGTVGAGYLFDYPTWVGQDEGVGGGAGNLFTLDSHAGHYYTSDASPLTFVWTETRVVFAWETIAAAFKGITAP